MTSVLALITGAMVAGSVFLMLSGNLVRFIFGLVLASNAVNLLIFAAGRPGNAPPPLVPEGQWIAPAGVANSLPQALILTAIVIGFALLAFVFILFLRAYRELGTVDTGHMEEAESRALRTEPGEREERS
jgi:multicomponent Na+:H+ antiporter subunit C